jgi:hypothetical protein
MKTDKYLLITNIFFFSEKNILVIKGLADDRTIEKLEYPLYLNNSFITNIFFTREVILEKKATHFDERARAVTR